MGAVIAAIWNLLHRCLNLSTETRTKKKVEEPDIVRSKENQKVEAVEYCSHRFNSNAFDALERRKPILENVMEAFVDPNTHLIGVYGLHDDIKDALLERVYRRIKRDNLFDLILMAYVTKKPNRKKIQEEIARQLGLTFSHQSKDKRAQKLIQRIKIEQKILIVLRDLHKGLDLGKVGIPYGTDHRGCKILLISKTEDVLSNHMHTQKNFAI